LEELFTGGVVLRKDSDSYATGSKERKDRKGDRKKENLRPFEGASATRKDQRSVTRQEEVGKDNNV